MTTEQLQTVEKCTSEDIGLKIIATADAAKAEAALLMEAIDEYLSIFAKPKDGKCLKCGTTLGGLTGAIMGGFRWGLAHGEGTCGCGWPARAYHTLKDKSGENVLDRPLQMILQYHPDEVTERKQDQD